MPSVPRQEPDKIIKRGLVLEMGESEASLYIRQSDLMGPGKIDIQPVG